MFQSVTKFQQRDRQDFRIWIVAAFTLVCLCFFWLSSRYPALNEKALMGDNLSVAGIAFDTLVVVLPDSSLAWEIFANIINWIFTNWRGMTFGLIIGASILTGLPLIARRSTGHLMGDAVLGGAIGSPLGLCTNCAAPIAYGMISAGSSWVTALAALLASPTLNAIVITMSFTLLPVYLATMKLVVILFFIMVVLPLLVRLHQANNQQNFQSCEDQPVNKKHGFKSNTPYLIRWLFTQPASLINDNKHYTALQSFLWFLQNYTVNLVRIVIATVPLMLLAGILGAICITLVPMDDLNNLLPYADEKYSYLLAIVMIAIVGTFLPVPIAFDVILVSILLRADIEPAYAAALLLTLGPFSVYSFAIVSKSTSKPMAISIFLAVILVGFIGSLFSKPLYEYSALSASNHNQKILAGAHAPDFRPFRSADRKPIEQFQPPQNLAQENIFQLTAHSGQDNLELTTQSFQRIAQASETSNRHRFTRIPGIDVGLNIRHHPTLLHTLSPYNSFHGIAAGDIDNDGFIDVIIPGDALDGGVSIWRNLGGRFVPVPSQLGLPEKTFVSVVALIDIDNDNRLDLFVGTRHQGTYIYYNANGKFSSDHRLLLPNKDAVMVGSAAFADLDQDGLIDIILGNWFGGFPTKPRRGKYPPAQTNRVLWNKGNGNFDNANLNGIPGETLTLLAYDINKDGKPDIIEGNDFHGIDKIHLNQGNRKFRLATPESLKIPWLAQDTMSIDAGDIDNDGFEEIYIGQISMPTRLKDYRSTQRPWQRICRVLLEDGAISEKDLPECFRRLLTMNEVLRFVRNGECNRVNDANGRVICAALVHSWNDDLINQKKACDTIPKSWSHLGDICRQSMLRTTKLHRSIRREGENFSFSRHTNILLKRGISSDYKDVASSFGVSRPGWTWNSKFVDLDQDGFLDLYVATDRFTSSKFYRNYHGTSFKNDTIPFGLTDYEPAFSSVFFDFDNDGDIDILRSPTFGYPVLFRNEKPTGFALWLTLKDTNKKRSIIGTKVEITTRQGDRQTRTLNAGGGYNSFDPQVLHFGFLKGTGLKNMKITWPDGTTSLFGSDWVMKNSVKVTIKRY